MKARNLLRHPAKPVIFLTLFLICILLASGCAPSPEEQATQTAQAQTATAAGWTATHTPKPTLTFTPTITPSFTPSPTATLVPTETPTPAPIFKSLLEMDGYEDCVQLPSPETNPTEAQAAFTAWHDSAIEWDMNNPESALISELRIRDAYDTGMLFKNVAIFNVTRGTVGSYASCAEQNGVTYYSFRASVILNDGTTGVLRFVAAAELGEMQKLTNHFLDFENFQVSPDEIFDRFAHPPKVIGWELRIPTSNIDHAQQVHENFPEINIEKTHELLQALPPRFFELIYLVATKQITKTQLDELNEITREFAVPVDINAWISLKK
jgi:hypothetical protein